MMIISDLGINFIARWEGCELDSYQDGGGVWTIGVGHTSSGCGPGESCTVAEAEQWLLEDLAWVEACLAGAVGVPLTQIQYDSLCSFVFNVGGTAFEDSTMLKKLNASDYDGAAAEFPRWVYDNGVVVQGLVNRRLAEQNLFLTGDYG